jgi:6-methylpretetramide 4-monooxygenase / 4-hydroxy-6-methylpretetramide 12a-monooxygenase
MFVMYKELYITNIIYSPGRGFGTPPDSDVTYLSRRWRGLVDVVTDPGDPRQAGLADHGAIVVRPDGYIGFRAVPADHAGLSALDAHLDSYLVPAPA